MKIMKKDIDLFVNQSRILNENKLRKNIQGKGEVKKKKEFDLKKELAAMIPQEHLGNLGNYVNNQGLNNQGLNQE